METKAISKEQIEETTSQVITKEQVEKRMAELQEEIDGLQVKLDLMAAFK